MELKVNNSIIDKIALNLRQTTIQANLIITIFFNSIHRMWNRGFEMF